MIKIDRFIIEKSKLKKLLFALMLQILLAACNVEQNISENNVKVSLTKDLLNNKATFFLEKGGLVKDSLTLYDLNFAIDSLTKINYSLWHYIYSVRCGSNCKLRNQIIIKESNSKLNLAYVSYYKYSFEFDELYLEDTTVKADDVMKYTNYTCSYLLKNDFFTSRPIVKEYIYKGSITDNGRGDTIEYELHYDAKNNIYYNQKQRLLGEFIIMDPHKDKQLKQKINEEVPLLKFKENEWLYYNRTWFKFNRQTNILIKFI